MYQKSLLSDCCSADFVKWIGGLRQMSTTQRVSAAVGITWLHYWKSKQIAHRVVHHPLYYMVTCKGAAAKIYKPTWKLYKDKWVNVVCLQQSVSRNCDFFFVPITVIYHRL